MSHKVIVPQKKIMSRSFLNSGTLIVTLSFLASYSFRTIHRSEIIQSFLNPFKLCTALYSRENKTFVLRNFTELLNYS
jgi:hypothetical protein